MTEIAHETQNLEFIVGLLTEAMSVMHKKGRAICIYRSDDTSYEADERGIQKHWKNVLPNGTPITSREGISFDEFRGWLESQPATVQRTVYQNLQDYINIETPKERGENEFLPTGGRYPEFRMDF